MSEKTWKARERRISKLMGTTRIPVTGERCGADCETPLFAVQIKARKTVPGFLFEWLAGIRGARPGKIGLVVMVRPGGKDLEAVVMLSLKDWLDLHHNEPIKGES